MFCAMGRCVLRLAEFLITLQLRPNGCDLETKSGALGPRAPETACDQAVVQLRLWAPGFACVVCQKCPNLQA